MLKAMASMTCSIKRPMLANGQRNPASATTVLSALKTTPPGMADVCNLGAMQQNGLIQSVSQVYETTLIGLHDIRPNDLAVIDNITYLVVAVAPWPTIGAMFLTMERVLQ